MEGAGAPDDGGCLVGVGVPPSIGMPAAGVPASGEGASTTVAPALVVPSVMSSAVLGAGPAAPMPPTGSDDSRTRLRAPAASAIPPTANSSFRGRGRRCRPRGRGEGGGGTAFDGGCCGASGVSRVVWGAGGVDCGALAVGGGLVVVVVVMVRPSPARPCPPVRLWRSEGYAPGWAVRPEKAWMSPVRGKGRRGLSMSRAVRVPVRVVAGLADEAHRRRGVFADGQGFVGRGWLG